MHFNHRHLCWDTWKCTQTLFITSRLKSPALFCRSAVISSLFRVKQIGTNLCFHSNAPNLNPQCTISLLRAPEEQHCCTSMLLSLPFIAVTGWMLHPLKWRHYCSGGLQLLFRAPCGIPAHSHHRVLCWKHQVLHALTMCLCGLFFLIYSCCYPI